MIESPAVCVSGPSLLPHERGPDHA
jgi:hypothetical protein